MAQTVRLANGVRINYIESGDPGGEPVLLLHGVTDSSWSFSTVLPHLPPDLHAFAIDQRGHGDSDRPDGYAMADFANDAAGFLDAVGVERATVVGHSMGGLVALRFALDHPDRLARLVLAGTSPAAGNPGVRALHDEVQRLPDPVPDEFIRAFQLSTLSRPLEPAFLERVVAESRKLPARVWQGAFTSIVAADVARDLHRLPRVPTLIVWGDRDDIFPLAEQERLRDGITGARLIVYAGGGHAFHWEEPERFARDLTAFIRGGA
jgi:pimeloyl-ACP methyl ester carboxylesterase